jgi:hypothetical protein
VKILNKSLLKNLKNFQILNEAKFKKLLKNKLLKLKKFLEEIDMLYMKVKFEI